MTKAFFIVKNEQPCQQILININYSKNLIVLGKCISEYEDQKAGQENYIFPLIYVIKQFGER